jgi:hypothetical protein
MKMFSILILVLISQFAVGQDDYYYALPKTQCMITLLQDKPTLKDSPPSYEDNDPYILTFIPKKIADGEDGFEKQTLYLKLRPTTTLCREGECINLYSLAVTPEKKEAIAKVTTIGSYFKYDKILTRRARYARIENIKGEGGLCENDYEGSQDPRGCMNQTKSVAGDNDLGFEGKILITCSSIKF